MDREELVPAIRKTADVASEVAAASAEQASGVTQLVQAMGVVDQVTQRNATAADQLNTSAASLQAQAETLLQLVGQFRVPGGNGALTPRMAATRPTPRLPAATA